MLHVIDVHTSWGRYELGQVRGWEETRGAVIVGIGGMAVEWIESKSWPALVRLPSLSST
jgi:hypothetical protein